MIALAWSALTSRLAGPAATAVAIALACFLVASSLKNVALKSDVAREHKAAVVWRDSSKAWMANARGWKASYRASEAFRDTEAQTAINAVSEANSACSARVAEARRSAIAIRGITHAPVPNCASRPIVGTDRLRDALAGPSDRPN